MSEQQRPMFEVPSDERQGIAEFLGKYWGQDSPEEIRDIRESMRAVCIRKFMSDGPGYFGPIYFVVFGGGPEFHLCITNYKGEGYEIIQSEFPPPPELQDPVMKHIMNDEQLTHDPGCTGDPERCDCTPDPQYHEKDEDCQVEEKSGCCIICGAGHGDPCEECGGKAYHKEGCTKSDAHFEEIDVTSYYLD